MTMNAEEMLEVTGAVMHPDDGAPCLQTLLDLLKLGDRSAVAGTPLVKNWPQVRASLLLIDRGIGLDTIPSSKFEITFPEAFDDLDEAMQRHFPVRRVYNVVRREVARLLSTLGHGDAWEAQRALLRELGRADIERGLSPLRTAAKRAGVAPAEVDADWVWSLEAEKFAALIHPIMRAAPEISPLVRAAPFRIRRQMVEARRAHRRAWNTRQNLRRAVVYFDALFDMPEIAASGLLLPVRIGAPPRYDRCGRRRAPLPAKLARIDAATSVSYPHNLQELWQAIHAAGDLGLPADPSPDDLLAPAVWDRIMTLPASLLAVSDETWTLYRTRARTALRRHATKLPATPEKLPAEWARLATTPAGRLALAALWRQIKASGIMETQECDPNAVLDLKVWRELWHSSSADEMAESTRRQYEMTARRILVRHATCPDPRRCVSKAWRDLPPSLASDLAPVRAAAEAAMLRPQDLDAGRLADFPLAGASRQHVAAALARLDDEAIEAVRTVPSDPVADAWKELRRAARARGFETSRLGALADPAIRDGRRPSDLVTNWVTEVSDSLSTRMNARFREALQIFDAMRSEPSLVPMLPAVPIRDLPDRRRRGNKDLPHRIAAELEAIGQALCHSANTRRENRSITRDIYTRASDFGLANATTPLAELLGGAGHVGLDGRKLRKAKLLLSRLSG